VRELQVFKEVETEEKLRGKNFSERTWNKY
jgi:hypothetical protein